jgi:hypothetical protein
MGKGCKVEMHGKYKITTPEAPLKEHVRRMCEG